MSVPSDTTLQMDAADTRKDIKPELRRSLLSLRHALDEQQRIQWNTRISEHIENHLKTRSLTRLGVYFSTQNEPDLMALYDVLSRKGITLSLPVVIKKATPLQFAQWKPGDPLKRDSYDISTPETRNIVPLPQALLVPCLGFTKDKYRLGYGGGYFDRTLEQKPRPHTIGVSYSCLQTAFPVDEHDIPLDCIITETGIVR